MAYEIGTRVRIVHVDEVTQGTTPATPSMLIQRTISRNINLTKRMLASQETHSHGQVQDLRHGFNEVAFSFGCEWGLNTLDDWLSWGFGASWASNVLKLSPTVKTKTIERQLLVTPLYEVFLGCAVNSMEFRLEPESIPMVTFNGLGLSAGTPSGTPLDAAPDAAGTDQPFDTFTGTIAEDGSPIAVVTGVNFTIARNRVLSPVIGSKFSPAVFEGTAVVTGEMRAIFQSHALYTKFIDESASDLEIVLKDPDNLSTKSMTMLLPRIKYTGNMKDPAREGPVIENIPFQALYDPSSASSIVLTRDITA
jgi:hypothetical protein